MVLPASDLGGFSLQYEELTDEKTETKTMKKIKRFIGIDPDLPKAGLTVINDRRFRIKPEGWRVSRKQYEKLIALVKPDIDKTLDILQKYGKLRSRELWMKRWEDVWNSNLETCEDGACVISLS